MYYDLWNIIKYIFSQNFNFKRGDKLSCILPSLPTHCFVIRKQGRMRVEEGCLPSFPDIEYHQIRRGGCSIFMHADQRIRLSFPPECVQDQCDMYAMVSKINTFILFGFLQS